MKAIIVFIISVLCLCVCPNVYAQTNKTKDENYYREYINKQKLKTYLRVKLKNDERINGGLTYIENDYFTIYDKNNICACDIKFSDVKEIKKGTGISKKITFAIKFPYVVARETILFTVFAIGYNLP